MLKKRLKETFVLLLACIGLQTFAQRQHLNIDDNWKFAFGNAASPEKDFNYGIRTVFAKNGGCAGTAIDPTFKDSLWRTIQLPHDWAVELPFVHSSSSDVESHGYKPLGGAFPETSIGWYRKTFRLLPSDSGKRVHLQFDGIFRDAQVWVNGMYAGNNKSGYVGVNYDITDLVNFQKSNEIVVRVDATQYEGWFYEGAGIYRHVWLDVLSPVHIAPDGIFAHATIDKDGNAALTIASTVQQAVNSTEGNYTIQARISDRNGALVASTEEQPFNVTPLSVQAVTQRLTVKQPTLWSLNDPYRYRVAVQLRRNGQPIDEQMIRFGFRTIDLRVDGVFLNGQHVKIMGTNNHQDHAGVGMALPDYLQYYRIEQLKKLGCNAYRTSHHAPTPELLDACDSLGMLVLEEQRLLNSSTEYLDQFERMVKRDRSRPSVFLWSIGNEEGVIQTTQYGRNIAQTLIQTLKQLDPTRTCTYAADVANEYKGVNEVIPVRGFNYRHFAVADYHRDHPLQPIIGTEMGSTVTTRGILMKDSVRGYVPDQDITAPWWASTAEAWWSLAAVNDCWLGGFVWTGFDYRGEPTPFSWPNINSHFGIMDVCGFPKNIYYYYKSWWTDEDVLHISPDWNQHAEKGKPQPLIDVWVNSNADNVELFLNGKSLGKKDMPRNGHLQWKVPYVPGKLEAIGYKKGKKLTAKVETTGEPYRIVMTPSKSTMIADGKDAVVINVSAVDKEGREVPDANNLIQFALEGDGHIIGVGNGDPSCHEPDKCADGAWQRSLFNGKCQLILQAGTHAASIRLKASASGLQADNKIIEVSN